MISLEDEEMDKLKEELEVLKSWGIESISVAKVLDMVKESEGGKDEIKIDVLFKGIPSEPTDLTPVGGTIFYIDDTADGVYESFLGITGYRGSGKATTEIVMAKDNGAYITDDSDGSPTIWYRLQQARDVKVGGCNDWFVPSVYEMEKLRKAILSGSVTGGKIAGSSYKESIFSTKWLWSSSEDSARASWHWSSNGQSWYTYGKNFNNSVFFARAF